MLQDLYLMLIIFPGVTSYIVSTVLLSISISTTPTAKKSLLLAIATLLFLTIVIDVYRITFEKIPEASLDDLVFRRKAVLFVIYHILFIVSVATFSHSVEILTFIVYVLVYLLMARDLRHVGLIVLYFATLVLWISFFSI